MYYGYITTIRQIRKHSNADKLQVVTVFGNDIVVDLSYHEGMRVIYFPTDGQLSEEFASDNNLLKKYVPVSELPEEQRKNIVQKDGVDVVNVGGYMDPNKRNVTTIRLRGETSDGLVLPLEVLQKYGDTSFLADGDAIDTFCGHEICRKYIPRKTKSQGIQNGKPKNKKELRQEISYPFFMEHIDTKQLAYNQNAFHPGDTCYITLKCHGTSARTANTVEVTHKKRNLFLKKVFKLRDKEVKRFQCVSGTRRTTLRSFDGGYYGSNDFRIKYHDFFKQKLPKGMCVYYEIVGYTHDDQTIMGRCSNKLVKDKEFSKKYGQETVFTYGCKQGENRCFVYRITFTNEDGYVEELPWEQVKVECEKMGVECVPEFEKFIFTSWDDLMERVEKYYDGPDPIGLTHIREGVVVRIDNRPTFTAYKHKNIYFKLLEGIIKENSDTPDMEEAEDLLIEKITE